MKIVAWIIGIVLLLAAVVYVQSDSPWVIEMLGRLGIREAPVELPLKRILIDATGREIETEVLGFSATEIAFQRSDTGAEYVIGFDRLSEKDQEFFRKRAPQGTSQIVRIKGLKNDLVQQRHLADRHATWHRDIQMAQREAESFQIPLCLLMLRSDENVSDKLDRFVIRSKEFREWANQRAALCLYYDNPGQLNIQSSLDSKPGGKAPNLAKKYGVVKKTPAFVILNPNASVQGKITGYGGEATSVVIESLEKVISGKTKTTTFSSD